jgi:hypothetical protein
MLAAIVAVTAAYIASAELTKRYFYRAASHPVRL